MRHALLLKTLMLSAVLSTDTAAANTLAAPDTVHASQNGEFAYRFTFTISPDSTMLAAYGFENGINVDGAITADCFCFLNCGIGPGEDVSLDVIGRLVEPTIPWGRIKARYR